MCGETGPEWEPAGDTYKLVAEQGDRSLRELLEMGGGLRGGSLGGTLGNDTREGGGGEGGIIVPRGGGSQRRIETHRRGSKDMRRFPFLLVHVTGPENEITLCRQIVTTGYLSLCYIHKYSNNLKIMAQMNERFGVKDGTHTHTHTPPYPHLSTHTHPRHTPTPSWPIRWTNKFHPSTSR